MNEPNREDIVRKMVIAMSEAITKVKPEFIAIALFSVIDKQLFGDGVGSGDDETKRLEVVVNASMLLQKIVDGHMRKDKKGKDVPEREPTEMEKKQAAEIAEALAARLRKRTEGEGNTNSAGKEGGVNE